MTTQMHLTRAVRSLPSEITNAMDAALGAGHFRIGPGAWETDLTVCPIVAAAKCAGVWHDGQLLREHPIWGSEDDPAPEVVEFAAWFDVCAEELGTRGAVDLVRETLPGQAHQAA